MIQPFTIDIGLLPIEKLRKRLAGTRWPQGQISRDDWSEGTNETYLRALCSYWADGFDWAVQQDYLNTFSHYKTEIDGSRLHFIHEKGKGEKRIPLLLIHGWPDSFVRFLKIIPLLTEPDENGLSFDVIVPSLPGYGFSDLPTAAGMNAVRIAELLAGLMKRVLGYQQFAVHGGDWGSLITEMLARNYTDSLLVIHLTDIPFIHLFEIPEGELSREEKEYLQKGKQWQQQEGAYAMIQSTQPLTLAYGLSDSPAGLAAWIIEKFYRWSDHHGDLETAFTKDELLTNLTIYWATGTIYSASRLYYESARSMAADSNNPKEKQPVTMKLQTPTGVALFPKDLIPAPKSYADRIFNICHWTVFKEGGHFAAMEKPVLLAKDIRAVVTTCSL